MRDDRIELAVTTAPAGADCEWAVGSVATCAAGADLTLDLDGERVSFLSQSTARHSGRFSFCLDHAHGVLRRLLDRVAAND